MSKIDFNKLYIYCKSLRYPSSEYQFRQDLKVFLSNELDSDQLENISGGSSLKNKLCASALSALSVLSSAGAIESIDSSSGNYYNDSKQSISWMFKHREAIITGISLFGLSVPYFYKHSIRPATNFKKSKQYLQLMMSFYFSTCLLETDLQTHWNAYQDFLDRSDNDINQALQNKIFNQDNYSEKIQRKIMECNDQVKHLILFCSTSGSDGFFTVGTTYNEENNAEAYSHVEKLIQQGDIKELNKWLDKNSPEKLSLLDIIVRFFPEILNHKPQMFVPTIEDCTDIKLVDFNIDFLNPENKKIVSDISILRNIAQSKHDSCITRKTNFLSSFEKLIESSI